MMAIQFELISGVCFGLEYVDNTDEPDVSFYILLELGFFRVIFTKLRDV